MGATALHMAPSRGGSSGPATFFSGTYCLYTCSPEAAKVMGKILSQEREQSEIAMALRANSSTG